MSDLIGQLKTAVAGLTTVTQYSVDKRHTTAVDGEGGRLAYHGWGGALSDYRGIGGLCGGLYRLVIGKNKFGGGQGS